MDETPPQKLVEESTGRVYRIIPETSFGPISSAHSPVTELKLESIIKFVKNGRVIIGLCIVIGAAIGLAMALSRPNVYSAEVTALPPQGKGGGGLSQMAAVAASAGLALPGPDANSRDAVAAILNSRSLHERLILKYNLREHYMTDSPDKVLIAFRKNWSNKIPKFGSTISFGYTHVDPKTATALTNSAAEILRELYTEMQQSEAAKECKFLEGRAAQARQECEAAATALSKFMQENKTVQIEAQAGATVSALGTLQGQLIAQKIELSAQLAVAANESNPLVQLTTERIKGLESEIAHLQGGAINGALIGLNAIPALAQQFLSLMREAKRHEALLLGIVAQLESSRLAQAREAQVVSIVDYARIPDIKSGPDRAFICIAATIMGSIIGMTIAFLRQLATPEK